MKTVTLYEERREVPAAEAHRLFQMPLGYDLHDAKVCQRHGKVYLDVVFRKHVATLHVSVDLLRQQDRGVPLTPPEREP